MRRETAEKTELICSACGAAARRGTAKYCLDCGKYLAEGFQPLDTIRSSYGLQRASLSTAAKPNVEHGLFAPTNANNASQFAWACFVYSLVPYLGTIFVPVAVVSALIGLAAVNRRPAIGGGNQAASVIGLSVLVLSFQILLWWLLYVIPQIGHAA
ncbi:MAG: hypothetical protein QUS14_10400 [Pyrinomonadaceae bacterium]|nr:hypothetical protein [Pyrinomonadaceae bacterium]